MARRSKYGARTVRVNGHLFRSQWERERYQQLELLQRAGEISELEFRDPPKFALCEDYHCKRTGKKVKAPTYQVDFAYTQDGERVYEDAKGRTLAANIVKRKIAESRHGVTIWFVYSSGKRV